MCTRLCDGGVGRARARTHTHTRLCELCCIKAYILCACSKEELMQTIKAVWHTCAYSECDDEVCLAGKLEVIAGTMAYFKVCDCVCVAV